MPHPHIAFAAWDRCSTIGLPEPDLCHHSVESKRPILPTVRGTPEYRSQSVRIAKRRLPEELGRRVHNAKSPHKGKRFHTNLAVAAATAHQAARLRSESRPSPDPHLELPVPPVIPLKSRTSQAKKVMATTTMRGLAAFRKACIIRYSGSGAKEKSLNCKAMGTEPQGTALLRS